MDVRIVFKKILTFTLVSLFTFLLLPKGEVWATSFSLTPASKNLNSVETLIFGTSTTCDPCGDCGGGQKPADWDKCNACISQEEHAWTVIGCLPTSAAGFIQKILQFAVSLAGGISFLLLLFAGFKILTSKGDVAQLASGKNLLVSSIVALFLILFAVFILRFIGFEILKIPGFGG